MSPRRRAVAWVARERLPPDLPLLYWGAAAALAVGAAAIHVVLAASLPLRPLDVEAATLQDGPPVLARLVDLIGLHMVRLLAAAAGGLTVLAAIHVGTRLLHSPAAGLLTGLLVALDPTHLALAHLATPAPFLIACALGALALLLCTHPYVRWAAAPVLLLGASLDPRLALWGPVLLALVMLRGNVYAAPKHLGTALAQTIAAPLLGVLAGALAARGAPPGLPPCLDSHLLDGLLLATPPALDGLRVALHNPLVWFAGLGALLILSASTFGALLGAFRLKRRPGRLQARLATPLTRIQGRTLWLLLLTASAPFTLLRMPLLALALAAGVRALSEDARGFGIVLATLIAVAAILYTLRVWGLITGAVDAQAASDLLSVVPWARPVAC